MIENTKPTADIGSDQRILAIGYALLNEGMEISFRCTVFHSEKEINIFIDIIRNMMIDFDAYQVVNDNTLLFINGSKIVFTQ